jgi:hypothetical protein
LRHTDERLCQLLTFDQSIRSSINRLGRPSNVPRQESTPCIGSLESSAAAIRTSSAYIRISFGTNVRKNKHTATWYRLLLMQRSHPAAQCKEWGAAGHAVVRLAIRKKDLSAFGCTYMISSGTHGVGTLAELQPRIRELHSRQIAYEIAD